MERNSDRGQWNWRVLALTVLIVSSASAAFSQTQPAANRSFSAASINLNRSGNNARQSMTPGRINFNSVSLKDCVMAADGRIVVA